MAKGRKAQGGTDPAPFASSMDIYDIVLQITYSGLCFFIYFFSPNLLCYFCKLLCNGTVYSCMYIVYTNHIQKIVLFYFFSPKITLASCNNGVLSSFTHSKLFFLDTNPICCQFYSSMLCPCVYLFLFELSFCIIFLLCSCSCVEI